MAIFDDMDSEAGCRLWPLQYCLSGNGMLQGVDAVEPLHLSGADARALLTAAMDSAWRAKWEADMQCISEDEAGRTIVSAWMTLVEFREFFCGRNSATDADVRRVLGEVRAAINSWRDNGVEVVELAAQRKL